MNVANFNLSENLVGRSLMAHHRVLKNAPRGKRSAASGLMVRDEDHVELLRSEGVMTDSQGHLLSLDRFWDFSERCNHAYNDKVAAGADAPPAVVEAAGSAVVPVSADSDDARHSSAHNDDKDADQEANARDHNGQSNDTFSQILDDGFEEFESVD
jgi:hypothetical protein